MASAAVIHWLAGKSRVLERRLLEIETRYKDDNERNKVGRAEFVMRREANEFRPACGATRKDLVSDTMHKRTVAGNCEESETNIAQPDLAQILAAIQGVAIDFGNVKSTLCQFKLELEEVRRLAASGKCIGEGELNSAKLEGEDVVHVQQNIEKDQLNHANLETEDIDQMQQTMNKHVRNKAQLQIENGEHLGIGHAQKTNMSNSMGEVVIIQDGENRFSEPSSVAEDDSGYEDDLDEEAMDKAKESPTTEEDRLSRSESNLFWRPRSESDVYKAMVHKIEEDERNKAKLKDELHGLEVRVKLREEVANEFGEQLSDGEIDDIIVQLFDEEGDEMMTAEEKDLELLCFMKSHPGNCRDFFVRNADGEHGYDGYEDYDEYG